MAIRAKRLAGAILIAAGIAKILARKVRSGGATVVGDRTSEPPADPRPTRRRTPRAQLREAYAEAARDPVYLSEMEETDRAFEVALADGLAG